MTIFIGIDLAWSVRNPSGAAVIAGNAESGQLVHRALLSDDASIVAFIEQYCEPEATLVAIDAPLWVPNQTGRRRAEAEIAQVFRCYEAGAHPANRQLLAAYGGVRGEALVAQLTNRGFVHKAVIEAGVAIQQVIEVFPHAAMVALFQLECTLKYKVRSRRSRHTILAAWKCYQAYLTNLNNAIPSLYCHEAFVAQDVAALQGKRLKGYEDQVDALFCAYITLYAFRWGGQRCRTFGTMEEGYMVTPVPNDER